MQANCHVVIQNGTIITANRLIPGGVVVIENGLIADFGQADEVQVPPDHTVVDAKGAYIAPGFVDIHCHGGGGVWSWEQPHTFALAHLKHGTTAILPTFTYNESREEVRDGLQTILEAMNSGEPFSEAIVGIHMEGPYINKKYGAITSPIRPVDPHEYERFYE